MIKRIFTLLLFAIAAIGLTACGKKEGPNTISVGTVAGPETKLMEVVKQVALKRYGLHVKIVTFTDYITPNVALNQGEIDANAYQHVPFLDSQIKAHGYQFVPVGKTFVFPMGIYSKKIKHLSQLKRGDEIAIPNDPSNEARALLLLQKAKLITLKPGAGINATPLDIVKNPLHLRFIQLGRSEEHTSELQSLQ